MSMHYGRLWIMFETTLFMSCDFKKERNYMPDMKQKSFRLFKLSTNIRKALHSNVNFFNKHLNIIIIM